VRRVYHGAVLQPSVWRVFRCDNWALRVAIGAARLPGAHALPFLLHLVGHGGHTTTGSGRGHAAIFAQSFCAWQRCGRL